jgi:hypothetical protein
MKAAFSSYPGKGHSPQAAALKFRKKQVLKVRGNVYERLSGSLTEEYRQKCLDAVESVASVSDEIKQGNLACILKRFKKL